MRFSIRDILLVTVIVAVLTGWGLDRWRLVRQVQEQQQEAELRNKRLLADVEVARLEAVMARDESARSRQVLLQAKKRFLELSRGESEAPAAAK